MSVSAPPRQAPTSQVAHYPLRADVAEDQGAVLCACEHRAAVCCDVQACERLLMEGVPLQHCCAFPCLRIPGPQAAVVLTTYGHNCLAIWREGACHHWPAVTREHLRQQGGGRRSQAVVQQQATCMGLTASSSVQALGVPWLRQRACMPAEWQTTKSKQAPMQQLMCNVPSAQTSGCSMHQLS
jgi:hypothetical protein